MKKFVFLFSIISFCILSGFIAPDYVYASDLPITDPGALSISVIHDNTTNLVTNPKYNIFGNYGVYQLSDPVVNVYGNEVHTSYTCYTIIFGLDSEPIFDNYGPNYPYVSSYSYEYTYDGISHTVSAYYFYFSWEDVSGALNPNYNITYTADISGTRIYPSYWITNPEGVSKVCNYFLFGVGDLEYDKPAQDIADSDLDIVGLSCYILNDQTGSIDWEETCKNTFMNFMSGCIRAFFDVNYDQFDLYGSDSHLLEGSIVNYVPGVALAWNAPPLDPDISYSVWVDGISKINYKTSLNPITDFRNTQQVSSCAYSKLQINDSPLVQSGSVYYQYNTNQGLQTILEFIENNSSLNPPSTLHSWNRYSYVNLETTISRVYIQASKEIDGDRHYGAISYVDIVDGQPIVHEGVTDSITDITPSDPETSGTTTTIGTPMTTSGNTIYTGDTITNNNEYNYNYGTGLIVGTTNPLGFIKRLFSAIFELIQSLYLAFLVPFILLGMTGSSGGIL